MCVCIYLVIFNLYFIELSSLNYHFLLSFIIESTPPSITKPLISDTTKDPTCWSADNSGTAESTPTTVSTSTVTTTTTVCGGDCGNIMCSLSPACIEDSFEERPDSSHSLEGDKEEDGSLRRRTKSEGCYSTAYKGKSSKKNVKSLNLILSFIIFCIYSFDYF